MRSSVALGIIVGAGLLLAAQTGAACVDESRLTSFSGPDLADRSFIWTATVFAPLYLETYPPLEYTVPYTARATASFWAAGRGDLSIGAGDDNGTFDLIAGAGLSYGGDSRFGVVYAAELDTDWSDPTVDGCNGADACTCLLLTDQDPIGRNGFFAAVAARSDANGDTSFNLEGEEPVGRGRPIVLRPIPVPFVTDVSQPQGDTLEITVALPDRLPGVYEAESGDGCSCDPIGYSIYEQVVTTTDSWVPPDDRDPDGWTLATTGIVALDQAVTVSVTCATPATQRVYLATQLHFEGGFSTAVVSGNSLSLACADGSLPTDPVTRRHPSSRRDSRRKTTVP